jgi:hypothetical protein
MLPFVHVVRGNRLLADQPVDAPLAAVAQVFDLDGGNVTANAGHAPMISEAGAMSKHPAGLDMA